MATSPNILSSGDYAYICMAAGTKWWTFDTDAAANKGWAYITLGDASSAQLFKLGGTPQRGLVQLIGIYRTQDGTERY
jgi:hypothetical protein